MRLTGHMLVKNEQNWIWYAIQSVLPQLHHLIIFDTGSTDKTVEIIRSIKSKKVTFHQKPIQSRSDITKLRNQMIALTQTDWFLLVDGDEVWSDHALKKLKNQLLNHNSPSPSSRTYAYHGHSRGGSQAQHQLKLGEARLHRESTQTVSDDSRLLEPYFKKGIEGKTIPEKLGAIVRTRNCVGDIFHYQPESAGHYHLKGQTGHLTIRAYKKSADFKWQGEYPNEAYTNKKGQKVNDLDDQLIFVDTFYYHLTHLKRSNQKASASVIDRLKKFKLEIGIKSKKSEIPQVFFQKRPSQIPDPFFSYSATEKILAHIFTPLKQIKRAINNS